MPTEHDFKQLIGQRANRALRAMLGAEQGKRAAARLAIAFAQAAASAKNPSALYNCSMESIVACIEASATTGIYPGGPHPKAYLVPRGGGALNFEITHRGIAVLAQRAGYGLRPIAVHTEDHVDIEFGDVVSHEADPDRYPSGLDDLRGVYVCMVRLSDGANMGRAWVPISIIRKRAESRQAGPVWRQWPVEMALKTAIKWCVARGVLVIDSDELDMAFAAENVIDADSMEVSEAPPVRRTYELPDAGGAPVPDFAAEAERMANREPVHAAPAPAPAASPAPAAEDTAAVKVECAELEPQVGPANVEAIRMTGKGPRPGEDVQTWKGRAANAVAYRDALRQDLADRNNGGMGEF